jgi:hypothetical protein
MNCEDQLADQQVKHLEMVQAVIARLGNDSFVVKGWAVTVATVLFGLSVNAKRPLLAVVAVVPTLMFWILDTYYLRAERLFRVFYEHVRTGRAGATHLKMDATSPSYIASLSGKDAEAARWRKTALRPTLVWLYLGLVIAAGAVAALAQPAGHKSASACSQRPPNLRSQPGHSC